MTEISIPSGRCSKLMNAALTATQKEILPSVWNAFLTLTLKGVLKDGHLAQKQLLICCRNGFYSNASQIGPSVLPLLARIWEGISDDSKRSEFAADLIKSYIKGFESERSNYEKAAILRTFAETIGFLIKNEVCDVETTHAFIIANLKNINSEFPKLIGTLVKDPTFYSALTKKSIEANVINSKEYGDFVVGLVTQPVSLFNDSKPVTRKGVKFRDPSEDTCKSSAGSSSSLPSFENLPNHKKTFLQDFVQTCVSVHAYKALSIVSRQFQSNELWSLVSISSVDLSKEADKSTRLRLSLDLIHLNPENPQILGLFSDQFEFFKEPADLQVFLKELDPFIHIQPIKKWIRMSVFTDVLEDCLKNANLSEGELITILKFIMADTFPDTYSSKISGILVERLNRDEKFFENLGRILTYSSFKVDLSEVYAQYWEIFLRKTINETEDISLELSESVCTFNRQRLSTHFLMEKLEQQLTSCKTVKQINSLVNLCKRLEFVEDDIELAVKIAVPPIKPEFLAFIGQSHTTEVIYDSLDPVPQFSGHHRSIIVKSIFHGRCVQSNSDPRELFQPAINVLYAQAIARIWTEVEKSEYFANLSEELRQELEVISSQLIESICGNHVVRREFKIEIEKTLAKNSQDPIWSSRLPIRILVEYCQKSEIKFDLQFGVPVDAAGDGDMKAQADKLLTLFSLNKFNIKESIAWISERRTSHPEDFEFDPVFRHAKNKSLMNKLLLITLELLERVDGEDNEEFLSTAACWIEAWLKHTKNLETTSKVQLMWISNLARGVKIIGERARALNNICPKFLQEYLEFHCAQIYPVIYALYNQLNMEVENHSFWTQQALYYVSTALATMPGTTLAFIKPDSIKVCDIFANILANGIHPPTRIAAYKVLRKVKYDTGDAKDLPIIPPGIDEMIKKLMGKFNVPEEDEDHDGPRQTRNEESKYLVSYLLLWDALLKIQQSSNEFASYVR